MKPTDKTAEEQYLQKTLKVVRTNIDNYSKESSRMQAEIDEMLEHYHSDDVELWTLLNNTITLNEHMKRALERNSRALEKPYFGRIIFRDETLGKEESLYIGKGGISSDHTTQLVVDWRAPVANAYYENGLGKCSYKAPDEKEIPIELKLKRTYEIEHGRLLDYCDTEVVANDDLLMKYLSKNKEAVLGEIVATIQKEQNEIIRKSPYHNVIVQGVAGSGKTTVAMHRISYILYNYKERFRPEDFYIVGSNRILLNYITGVLPDLDVHGVRQMTMEQLFVRLLYEDWDEKKYRIRPVSGLAATAVKGSAQWYQALLDFIRNLEASVISTEDVLLKPRQFVEGLQEGKPGIYDKTTEDQAAGRDVLTVPLVSGASTARYLSQNPSLSLQSKINMLNERLMARIQDEFLNNGIRYTEAEKRAIRRFYRSWYGERSWKRSIFSLYQDFLAGQAQKGIAVDPVSDSFDVYDLASLALLYKLVKETEVISEAHHIVIDEAQDFGMLVYHALHDCIKDCTYTIMGDVSQNIHFGYGLGDWEALRRLLLPDPMDSFGILKKSYRNTVEISNYATHILRHGNFPVYPVEPIIRHGSAVMQEKVPGDASMLAKRAAAVCRQWQSQGYDTIAVVCRDEQESAEAAKLLSKNIEILENDLEKADFGAGIMVLPVAYTKGLEFDAVLIWNPDPIKYPTDNGHARLLYVAATRALHELSVLYCDQLTGLICEPLPESQQPQATLPQPDDSRPTYPQERSTRAAQEAPAKQTATATQRQTPQRTAAEQPKPSARTKRAVIIQRADNAAPARRQGTPPDARTAAGRQAAGSPGTRTATGAQTTGLRTAAGAHTCGMQAAGLQFGDLPPTESLRPAGHAKISTAVRWVSREADGLYLQSQYGVLRISPVGSAIMRLTFSKGSRLTEGVHPLISSEHVEKNWKYRDSTRTVDISTKELTLSVDKPTGAIRYLDTSGRLLLAEQKNESRLLEASRSFLFLSLAKSEKLFGLVPGMKNPLPLRGSAKVLSAAGADRLPLLLSDAGYGLVPASAGVCFFCDIPAYGTYLCAQDTTQDYYFITGKQQATILNAYAYLTGLL